MLPTKLKLFICIYSIIFMGCSKEITIDSYEEYSPMKAIEDFKPFEQLGVKISLEETLNGKEKELLMTFKGTGMKMIPEKAEFGLNFDYKTITKENIKIICETLKIQTNNNEELKVLSRCNFKAKINLKLNKEFPTYISFSYPKKEFNSISMIMKIEDENDEIKEIKKIEFIKTKIKG